MKCFYHSADLDGHCSGAIVKYTYPECEMIGINYGQEFPWESIEKCETVLMVDFTLQPFDQMERLAGMCELVWIDHHKTEIEEAQERGIEINGLQRIGIGACALVWEYLYKQMHMVKIPSEAVQLLAEYDVWNHSNPDTLPFQYGFRMFGDTHPDNQELWGKYITSDVDFYDVVETGKVILEHERRQNEKFCQAYSFPTNVLIPGQVADGEKYIYPVIACNRGFTNSKIFDSVWDEDKYDLMVTFVRLKPPAHKWTVSLYSTKDSIDCGKIARIFGGGGHKGAAGFQCGVLPFKY